MRISGGPRARGYRARGFLLTLALMLTVDGAAALDPKKDEKDRLKACERRLCALVVDRRPDSGDLTCALSKTWARQQLKDGSSSKKISWGFGDARCSIDLKVPHALLIAAVQQPEHV